MKTHILDHLGKRRMNFEIYNPIVDYLNQNVCYFKIYDLMGNICNLMRYNSEGCKKRTNSEDSKYYFISGNKKNENIFGLETLYLSPNILFICEGIFDSCSFSFLGYSSIAINTKLSSISKNTKRQIDLISIGRKTIYCPDIDDLNFKKEGKNIIFPEKGKKDIGDSSIEYIKEQIKNLE